MQATGRPSAAARTSSRYEPVLGRTPADQVVLPAVGPAALHEPPERPDHLELLLVVAGPRQEEPPDRQDHRVLVRRRHQGHRRVQHVALAPPQLRDPALGVPRVGQHAVVGVQELEAGPVPGEQRHPRGQAPAPTAARVHAHDRNAQRAGVGADPDLGRHPPGRAQVDVHGSSRHAVHPGGEGDGAAPVEPATGGASTTARPTSLAVDLRHHLVGGDRGGHEAARAAR